LQVKSISNLVRGLQVDAGSTLTINAVNSTGTLSFVLDLTGAAGVTGLLAGSLYFMGGGMANGDAYLNLFSSTLNYARVTVKNGGLISYAGNSGNTVSAAGPYLVMESGAVYEINKNGGSVPPGNWDDNAAILITGATTSGGISFSQEQYGNLIWNTPLMSAVTQLISPLSPVTAISFHDLTISNTNGRELRLKTGAGSVSPPSEYTVRGNLSIASAGTLVITGNNVVNTGAGGRLHVMGGLTISGNLRSDGPAGTVNVLELNGTDNQDINNTGDFSGPELQFIMNNPAGATLLTPLTIPGTNSTALQLINGRIKASDSRLLSMLDNAGYTGGSATSFIEGPLQKTGDDGFSFPVGKGAIYAPVRIEPAATLSEPVTFVAEYLRLNPQASFGTNYETPIDHISYSEYWRLENTGAAVALPGMVTLPVTAYSFAKDIGSLLVARYEPGVLQWQDAGISSSSAGPVLPPYVTGTITTSAIAQWGIFTLASGQPVAFNPLPVDLVSFNAENITGNHVCLTWELSDYSTANMIIELDRSVNGSEFTRLQTSRGSETQRIFTYVDEQPAIPVCYYRLKILEENGRITQSRVIKMYSGPQPHFSAVLIPNPVHTNAVLDLYSPHSTTIKLAILNETGQLVRQWERAVAAGTGNLTITADGLKPGFYVLAISAKEFKTALHFIKR
jgi:hypothetical protein